MNARTLTIPGQWAADAQTTIPAPPIPGIAYRNTSLNAATMRAGQQYSRIADSAQWNQLHYLTTGMATEVERYGLPRYSPLTNYYESAFCLSLDGALMQAIKPSGPANGGAKPTTDSNYWKVAIDFDKTLVRTKVFSIPRFHVRVDGNNNNSGLEDTPQGALRDWNGVAAKALQLDFNGFNCYVHFGDGEFTTPISTTGALFLSAHWVVLYGNDDANWNGTAFDKPSRTILAPTVEELGDYYWGILADEGGELILHNLTLSAKNISSSLFFYNILTQRAGGVHFGSRVTLEGKSMENNSCFALCSQLNGELSEVFPNSDFPDQGYLAFKGFLAAGIELRFPSGVSFNAIRPIISTATYANAFAHLTSGSTLFFFGAQQVYNQSTGSRYFLEYNSTINTYGKGVNLLPGNTAGTVQQGALYV